MERVILLQESEDISVSDAVECINDYGIILAYKNSEIFGSVIRNYNTNPDDWILDVKEDQTYYKNLTNLMESNRHLIFKFID